MKWLFFLLMLGIFFNLFRGLFFLLKEGGDSSQNVVRSLTIRVGLTVVFFGGLYVADHFELIEGHGLRGGLTASESAPANLGTPARQRNPVMPE